MMIHNYLYNTEGNPWLTSVNVIAMGFHFEPTSECFWTFWTMKWFVSGVDCHVTPQMPCLQKSYQN